MTNHNAAIIYHVLTNSFDSKIDTGISMVDDADHFLIFFKSKLLTVKTSQDLEFDTKRNISSFTLSLPNPKEKLLRVDW